MLKGPLLERLAQLAGRATELETLLARPDVIADPTTYQKYAKEYGFASRVAAKQRHLAALERRRAEASTLLAEPADKELAELAREELAQVDGEQGQLEAEIEGLLLEDDADARRDVILEIRAGTGGEEAGLFAADLSRMYLKYAENRGWKTDVVSAQATELGGLREIIIDIRGRDVYRTLRHESGGHRVQRVPVTEAAGRIHTSAVTVAVLPQAEEVDVRIDEKDLKIDRFCASGPGGQHVNKTASAVRVTHLPTGLVVSCQDEKSQHKNLAKAMRVLRSRLYEHEVRTRKQARDAARRAQIGSGDRNDRVRTYNFPQNRLTDHRLNANYPLDRVIQGELDRLMGDLEEMHKEQVLAELQEATRPTAARGADDA